MSRKRGEIVDRRRCICAPAARSANSRSSMRSSSLRIVIGGAQRRFELRRAPRRARSAPRRAPSTAGSSSAGACARLALQPAHAGWPAPAPATSAPDSTRAHRADRSAIFSACIMRGAPLGERRSPRRAAARACASSSTACAQIVGLARAPRSTSARCAATACFGVAPAPPQPRDRRPRRRRARQRHRAGARCVAGIDQRAVVVLAVDLDQRARRAPAAACTLTGWSLTKARVRPSAICTRRRIRSPSSSMPLSREQRARRMVARHVEHRGHLPLLGALAHQRGVAARAQRQRKAHRAGSTCRRRSRRSARSGRRRNRCRAGRSGRYRGSKAGRAWPQSSGGGGR